jgi:hypothetical protein
MKSSLYKRLYSKVVLAISISFAINHCSYCQVADFSKSYINITKGSNGGTTEPGNVLEIRATFVVRSGSFDSCAYYGIVPAGTVYVPNTLRLLTNEGKIYKQFTDALTDDAGWINGTNIRINLGYNPSTTPATAFRRGTVASSDKPSYYTTACIMVASFRVTVTGTTGTNINTGAGSISFKNGSNPIFTYTFPPNTLKVYSDYGLGTGSTGPNLFTAETNGTFGGGKPRNRTASANVPSSYTYQVFNIGSPHDSYYGIGNNTSTQLNYTTSDKWAKPDTDSPSHRVFRLWDIIGDHTGAASASLGNPAADTVASSNAGYMLVVNSAYKTDSAFQATVNGLCPNTLYEVSCWFRNICSKCGCDSNGKAATNTTGSPFYIPTGPGDSSGIAPNLIFEINGVDHYTTGNMTYTGEWIRKGFSYVTGPSQTNFTFRIFNNAPAGSGNDWAVDDIVVSSVAPKYSPATNAFVCQNNSITIYDTIRSAAGNYIYYKWQRSTNDGASWTDITTAQGPASPYLNGNVWEYVASHTVTPARTTPADSGDLYRVIVSGTSGNLSSATCSYTDTTSITLNVTDCNIPLDISLLSFSGSLKNNMITLDWATTGVDEPVKFDIEKSINNSAFAVTQTIDGVNEGVDAVNTYTWIDPAIFTGKVYYRLKIYNRKGRIKYSRIIAFTSSDKLSDLVSINNPFGSVLSFDIYSGKIGIVNAKLIDGLGNPVKSAYFNVAKGMNYLRIDNLSILPPGIYILSLYLNGEMINRKLLKQ